MFCIIYVEPYSFKDECIFNLLHAPCKIILRIKCYSYNFGYLSASFAIWYHNCRQRINFYANLYFYAHDSSNKNSRKIRFFIKLKTTGGKDVIFLNFQTSYKWIKICDLAIRDVVINFRCEFIFSRARIEN